MTTPRSELIDQITVELRAFIARSILRNQEVADELGLHLVDLQYSDIRPDRGLYNRLAARGRMLRLTDDAEIARAVEEPPEDTRAYFRGRCLQKYASSVAAASWDSVIFDIPGRESLQRVPTLEPLRGTRAHVGDLLDRSKTAAELVAALTS